MIRQSGAGSGHPWHALTAVLTTRHGKAAVIAPSLHSALRLGVVTHRGDTDALGTFTGETDRRQGQEETALAKARLGLAASSHRLAVASEGSFAPHPEVALLTVNRELVVLVDRASGLSVTGHAVSLATTTFTAVVRPGADLTRLLVQADVPRHRLIVRPHGVRATEWSVHKGIAERGELVRAIEAASALSPERAARVETDLRAHVCPSRREVIARAADDLATRAARLCPGCAAPGWGPRRSVRGAACRACGAATSQIDHVIWACNGCSEQLVRRGPHERGADPAACPDCNP